MNSFEILLENSKRYFQAGEIVKGHLLIITSGRVKINFIQIELKGKGKVLPLKQQILKLSEIIGDNGNKETYLKLAKILALKTEQNECYLKEGENIFRFELLLPSDLPASFEHENAQIRYKLKATISRPWDLNHTKIKRKIVVFNKIKCNLYPSLADTVIEKSIEQFNGITLNLQEIKITVTYGNRCYFNGDVVNLVARIENKSMFRIDSIVLILNQMVTCKSKAFKGVFEQIIKREIIPKSIEKQTFQKYNINMPIPIVSPSSDGKSSILDVSYNIALKLQPETIFGSANAVVVPILIGFKDSKEIDATQTEPVINSNNSFLNEEKYKDLDVDSIDQAEDMENEATNENNDKAFL